MNSNAVNTSVKNSNAMQLVPAFTGMLDGKEQLLVNARNLHEFLKVGRDFSNWLKKRISDYDFVENHDFAVFAKVGENPEGGRPQVEYHISLDMAKELSMVEKTEKGRQARRYFISMEQHATHQQTTLVHLNTQLKDKLMSQHLRYRQMYRYLQKELSQEEIARCMQISTRMVRMLYREMQELELLPEQEVFVLAHTGRISRMATQSQLGLEM